MKLLPVLKLSRPLIRAYSPCIMAATRCVRILLLLITTALMLVLFSLRREQDVAVHKLEVKQKDMGRAAEDALMDEYHHQDTDQDVAQQQEHWRHFYLHHLYKDKSINISHRMPSQRIPRIIHYVWCQKAQFTYNNFMSVLSAIRAARPDAIYFYHTVDSYPQVDKWMYNTWLEELRYNFPWFIAEPEYLSDMCQNGNPRLEFILGKLRLRGGVYISFDTLLVNFDDNIMKYDLVFSQNTSSKITLLATTPHFPQEVDDVCKLEKHSRMHTELSCPEATNMLQNIYNYPCLKLGRTVRTPKDSIDESTANIPLHRYFRKLFYGQETIPKMVPNPQPVVPKVGHYVWFTGGRMDHVFYLGVLSVLYIVKMDIVYIHGDLPPSGPYWHKLMHEEREKVQWVYRPRPTTIFNSVVGRVEHAADVARHDIMLKYGGLHMDADVIFSRPIDSQLFHYDTVVTLDNYLFPVNPYPDTFNLGVVITRPQSRFWRLYQLSERYFYEDDYTWNSNRVPYKIWERNPDLLHVDSELQVICCHLKCYPTWVKTRKEAFQLAENPDAWEHRPMSYHWTWPSPPELENQHTTTGNNTLFALIGQRVLKAAGKWNVQAS